MWLTIILCKSRKTSPSPEFPGSTSVPCVQHSETAPAHLPMTSGVSTPNHGSGTEVKNKVGDVVNSTLKNFGNTKIHAVSYLGGKPSAQLPVSTSGVSTPNLTHGSRTVIKSKVGDVVGSTISKFGNNNLAMAGVTERLENKRITITSVRKKH